MFPRGPSGRCRYTISGALHLLASGESGSDVITMIWKLPTVPCFLALAIASAGLTSCNKSFKGSFSSSSSSRTDLTVNSDRTITKKVNDLKRKLEMKTDVATSGGKITSFPKGAVVKMEETGSTTPRVAELRENGGSLELWVKENGTFRRGTAEEETWRDEFLKDVVE